jgi:hypothetical protein
MRHLQSALTAAVLAFLACADTTHSDATRAIERVYALSLPADATETSYVEGDRGAYSLSAQWEFTTAQPWPAYCAWLEERLAPDFEKRESESTRARFVRVLPADVYDVTLESEPSQRGVHV